MRIQLKPPKHLSKTIFFFLAFWVVGLIGMMRCAEAQIAFTADNLLSNKALDMEPEIYVIAIESKDIRQLTHHDQGDWAPAWAPDGKQIAYSSREKDDLYSIYVINADGGKRVALVENLELAVEPAWSPKPLAISPKGKLSTLWARIKIRE